jgi:hypothetical protein
MEESHFRSVFSFVHFYFPFFTAAIPGGISNPKRLARAVEPAE